MAQANLSIKLGRVAIWNALTRGVVKLNTPTLGLLKKFDPDTFDAILNGERPVAMGDPKFTW